MKKDNERTQNDICLEQEDMSMVQKKTLDTLTNCKQLELELNGTNMDFKDMLDQLEVLHQRKM